MNVNKALTLAEALVFLAIAYVIYLLWGELSSAGGALAAWLQRVLGGDLVGTGDPPGPVDTGTLVDNGAGELVPFYRIEPHQNPNSLEEIIGNQAHDGLDPFNATGGFYS